MAYEIGFVDNTGTEGIAHKQLLKKIKTLAEANGWTTLRYDTTSAVRELILQGEGLSGTDEIFIGFRTNENVSADYYNLSVAGFTGYVSGNAFDAQPGYREHGVPAHNNRIDYWITVNAQRIAFGLKVGTPVYESAYAGKFFPFATPSQYPYPLFVGGMVTTIGITTLRFSDTAHSGYMKGGVANAAMRWIDGTWKTPAFYPQTNAAISTAMQLRDTAGHYKLIPLVLYDSTPNIYGQLDGVYSISGFNNAVENTLTIGGKDYVVIQDVGRTGFTDYYALELD